MASLSQSVFQTQCSLIRAPGLASASPSSIAGCRRHVLTWVIILSNKNHVILAIAADMKRLSDDDDKKSEREAWRSFDTETSRKSKTHLFKEDDGQSWVTTCRLAPALMPSESDTRLRDLWALRPAERSVIQMAGRPVTVPRYNQAYGRSYQFSGANHAALPLPPLLQPYMDFANRCCATMLKRDYGGRQFNMAFVNWYEDGQHYIGWHADKEAQLYRNQWGETLVFSISLGQQRRFLMKPKPAKPKPGAVETKPKTRPKPICFELKSGDCLVMGGLCQAHYKHSVPKENASDAKLIGGRINMTFRIFK